MCYNYENTTRKKVIGYKLVAVHKKTGDYYSAAMGFKYKKNGLIPICVKQRKIKSSFSDLILTACFSQEMVGRTAVFELKDDALNCFGHNGTIPVSKYEVKRGYTLKVVKVELTKGLLKAEYNNKPVCVGKKLKFLE